MKLSELITIDKEIQNGTPVFKHTRVPIQSLFWHIESGVSIDDFLEDFSSVKKEQAIQLLTFSEKIFTSPELIRLYESAA
jgi:uncharacterized protein (DUF433 family)